MQSINESTKKTVPKFRAEEIQPPVNAAPVPEEVRQFNFILIVVNPFDNYQRGNVIADDSAIQAVIDAGKVRNCSKISR